MSWWGKCIGGAFGMMFGGPLGAVLGAVIGHKFDKGLNETRHQDNEQERAQLAFFTAAFSVMGHICKADRHVSKDEIRLATRVIEQMSLNKEQKKMARALFDQGKKPDFPLYDIIQQFKKETGRRTNLHRMFLEIQVMASYADGIMHAGERKLLVQIAQYLNFPISELEYLCMATAGAYNNRTNRATASQHASLHDAYTTLGVEQNTPTQSVKRAYRRLISQYHPDKLVSKGLPDEMMKLAETKTNEIRKAYEMIKKERGF